MTKQWPGAGCKAAPQPAKLPVGRNLPWLAPLAGYSDLPFRTLCREYGAACCVTEMVSAKGLCYNGGNTWKVLATAEADTPLVVQLFGSEPEFLEKAVHILRERGFSWFDLNMGCPVPKVAKQGAGVSMLKDPDNALACAKAMIGAAEPGHVSFKLRLGVTAQNENWLDVALRLEDAGAALITLHPRTGKEGYSGHAHWEELRRAKESLGVPVLASGDLFSAADGMRCLEETGADGVMYARGALTNPRIFSEHISLAAGKAPEEQTAGDLRKMIRRHMELIGRYGGEDNALFRLRSIVPRYVRSMPGVRYLRQRLCTCGSFAELDEILGEFLQHNAAAAGGEALLQETQTKTPEPEDMNYGS